MFSIIGKICCIFRNAEICIERKSVSDLIGSLNSGRLFNQVTRLFTPSELFLYRMISYHLQEKIVMCSPCSALQ